MKMIIRDTEEFLNMLYGSEEAYHMNMNNVKVILKEHVKSLENLYKAIEYLDNVELEDDLYNLGDIINLVDYISKNIKKEEEI